MKKVVIGLLFFCCCINSYSQAIYFNNRYDFNGDYEGALSILEIDSGYVISGKGWTNLIIAELDANGIKKRERIYQKTGYNYYAGSSGSLIKTSDGGYALGGSVDLGSVSNGMLWRFDENIDTLWTKTFGDTTIDQLFYQCKQTPDSGFILIGVTTKADTNGDIWLVKTDKNGNFEWEKTYGGDSTEYGFYIDTCYDKGFIIGGEIIDIPSDNIDWWVIKTDSTGKIEWQKNFGGTYEDLGTVIKQTKDGGYVVAGGYSLYENPTDFYQSKPRIIKLNSLGNVEWDKMYAQERYAASVLMIHELQDGQFIVAGQSNNNKGTPNGNGWAIGFILKINAQGDSSWYREFEYDSCEKNEDYVRDMKPTSDGGFIVAGFFVPSSFYCSNTGTQDMWVVKLDSCGCPYKDCDLSCSYPIGIKENGKMVMENGKWKIYPNPTEGVFVIKIMNSEQGMMNDEVNGEVKIYNLLGEVVYRPPITDHRLPVTIDLTRQPPGVYFVKVVTGWGAFVGKVVKME